MSAPRWLDGRWLAEHEPMPAADAGGVFETVRSEGGMPAFAREHVARMARGARALAFPWPPPWDPLAALVAGARASGPEPRALRLTCAPPHLVLEMRALEAPPRAPLALLLEPGAVELPRPFGVKSTHRAAYDEGRAAAQRAGAFDALVRTSGGELVEGTITNLFVARAGELVTPPVECGALPGIVRAALLDALAQAPLRDEAGRSWRAFERMLTAADLATAEEIVLTNSIVRVLPLAGLRSPGGPEQPRDDLPGTRGPLARALLALLARIEAFDRERRIPDPAGFPGPTRAEPAP